LLTNAGFYLVDCAVLREVAGDSDLAALRRVRLDFGKDLLPWLVDRGYPVRAHAVRRIGDLGNVQDFVDTMVEALHGSFESVRRAGEISVYPRLKVPNGMHVPRGTELVGPDDVLRYL